MADAQRNRGLAISGGSLRDVYVIAADRLKLESPCH